MTELLKALRPVRRRIRRNRALRGAAAGLAAGAAAALLLLLLARFVPVPDKTVYAALLLAAGIPAGAAAGALIPVKNREAATAADACGLRERTVTALENAGGDGPMVRAQRRDALDALRKLDVKQIRPAPVRKALLAALAACVLGTGLLLLPGGQDRKAEELKTLRTEIARAESATEEALKEDEKGLSEAEKSELRKIRDELMQNLDRSRDETDALVALDKAEKRLEQMRSPSAGGSAEETGAAEALAQALQGAGLESQAQAVLSGDENALAQALAGMSAEETQALAEAMESLNGEALAAAEAMEGAAQSGDAEQAAAQALQALSASGSGSMAASAMQQAVQGLKAALGGQGNGPSGSEGSGAGTGGSGGQGTGSGAGRGTTNEDQGGNGTSGNPSSGPVRGNDAPEYREGKYETIYDPERVDIATRDVMTNQQQLGNDSVQIEAGQGRGTLEGDVPYTSVIGEYASGEAKSAESENLTAEQREWVAEYFRLLTEQQ